MNGCYRKTRASLPRWLAKQFAANVIRGANVAQPSVSTSKCAKSARATNAANNAKTNVRPTITPTKKCASASPATPSAVAAMDPDQTTASNAVTLRSTTARRAQTIPCSIVPSPAPRTIHTKSSLKTWPSRTVVRWPYVPVLHRPKSMPPSTWPFRLALCCSSLWWPLDRSGIVAKRRRPRRKL